MRSVLLIFCFSLVLPFSALADYYRYVDQNGIPCFVDTVEKVPKEYKDQVVYQIERTGRVKYKDAGTSIGALLKKKAELDDEYSVLMKEKEVLLEAIRRWEDKYKAWENKKSSLE